MILLIDAYNVLKTVLHVQFVTDNQRTQFLQFFNQYAQLRSYNQVILIFDGGQDIYEAESMFHYITIIYAGGMQSADDVIKKKLQAYQGYDILLVTCDRELRKYAANLNIESFGSVEFYKKVQQVLNVQERQETIIAQTIHKTSDEENPDLDALMELASRRLVIKDQDRQINISSRVKSDTINKKDKKLFKKIAKI